MPRVQDIPVETLLQHLTHLAGGCPYCIDPVHRWSLPVWEAVLTRILDHAYVPWTRTPPDPDQIQRLTQAATANRVVVTTLIGLLFDAESTRHKTEARIAALETELRQLQAGHLLRSHDEILSAIEAAHRLIARTKVTARAQYAAARVAEALKWVLEHPETPTTTTAFNPKEPA